MVIACPPRDFYDPTGQPLTRLTVVTGNHLRNLKETNTNETHSCPTADICGACCRHATQWLRGTRLRRDPCTSCGIRWRHSQCGTSASPGRGHRCCSATGLRLAGRLLELVRRPARVGCGPLGRASPRLPLGCAYVGSRRRRLAATRRALGSPLTGMRLIPAGRTPRERWRGGMVRISRHDAHHPPIVLPIAKKGGRDR